MFKKLRGLYKKLDKRLMIIICLTVIPVNILAILLSSFTVKEAGERIKVSYEKEFRAFMDREMAQMERLDAWYNNFITDYLRYLSYEKAFDAVESIHLLNDASHMFDMYGINGIIIVKENQGDERLYVKSLKGLYSFDEFEQVKQGFADFGGEASGQNAWSIVPSAQRFYFVRTCNYVNYTLGIGIDIGKELDGWFDTEMAQSSAVLMSDGNLSVLSQEKDGLTWISKANVESYMDENSGHLVGSTRDEKNAIRAWLYYDEPLAGKTPAYFFMQLMAWFSLIVLFVLWLVIRRQVIAPMKVLQSGMRALDKQDWNYRIVQKAQTDDYDYIYKEFNKMADDVLESHEKDIELYKTQMNNLKLQVNPHMLLNSLTMIYSLAETKQNALIQKYTMNLVEYFRYCLRENNSLVPLKSEIRFVENYMEIQKLRYPGLLAGVYMLQDGVENLLVPPLLIQNFVENATKYARIPNKTIEVLINIRRDNDRLLISVSDTGAGMDDDILQCLNDGGLYEDRNGMRHIGVWNCRRRLELFFGDAAKLRITSRPGEGTQVWIELPCREMHADSGKGGRRHDSADR